MNRMESANTSDPGGSVTGFSQQKYWAPGEQIYTKIVVVYLKFKFNSRLSGFFSLLTPPHEEKRRSVLWFYSSALIRPLDQAPTLGAPLELGEGFFFNQKENRACFFFWWPPGRVGIGPFLRFQCLTG